MNFFIQFLTYSRIICGPIIFLVALLFENYSLCLLLFFYAAISDFLESGALSGDLKEISEQKKIAFNTSKVVNTIETKIAPRPDKAFAEVTYEGSLAKVSLNSRNKYVNHYKDNDQNIKLLEELAVALDISLNLIKDDESKQVQHALDRLFNEFNRQLNKLVTGK